MFSQEEGIFVFGWDQTEVDGIVNAPLEVLAVGATWGWRGAALRLDAGGDRLVLRGAAGQADLHRRAARVARRLIGMPPADDTETEADLHDDLGSQSFLVTDGRQSYSLMLVKSPGANRRLLVGIAPLPPQNVELWVVRSRVDPDRAMSATVRDGGVICFTPGTRIATPDGLRAIETLQQGDLILTKDNGPQPVIWSGQRRMSGARLFAMPHLRPVRLRAGALGIERPEPDLLVSPHHRLLIKGRAAERLFGTPEVLVKAEDLINDTNITTDRSLREVTYVHIMLDAHNIVFANGIETESFHPSNAALETIDDDQRAALMALVPGVEVRPEIYGDYARRNLSTSEAAILRHDLVA